MAPTTQNLAYRPRRRRILRDSIDRISKPSIRRLARRGGIARVSRDIYPTVKAALEQRLREILKNVVAVAVDLRKSRTIYTLDVVYALKFMNQPIWGFGTPGLQYEQFED